MSETKFPLRVLGTCFRSLSEFAFEVQHPVDADVDPNDDGHQTIITILRQVKTVLINNFNVSAYKVCKLLQQNRR